MMEYAEYIWPSYAVVAVVMIGLLFVSWRSLKTKQSLLEALRAARNAERNGNDT